MNVFFLILLQLTAYAQTQLVVEKQDTFINIKSDIARPEYCQEMQGHFRGQKSPRINVCLVGNGQFNRETFDYLHQKDWFSPKNKKDIATVQMNYSLPRIEVTCFKNKSTKSIIQNDGDLNFKFILSCDLKNKKEIDHEMNKILSFLKKNFENKKNLATEISKNDMKKWLSFLGLENPSLKLSSIYEESPIFINCPDEVEQLKATAPAKFEPSSITSYLPKNKISYDEKQWSDPKSKLYKEQYEIAKRIQQDFEYKGSFDINQKHSILFPAIKKEIDHPEVYRAEYWFECFQKEPCVKESDFKRASKIYMKDGATYEFYFDNKIRYSLPIGINSSGHEITFLPDGSPRKSMFSDSSRANSSESEPLYKDYNFRPDLDESEF